MAKMEAYAERKEWADVLPIEQNDGPDPPCAISYSKEYIDAMNYFRAIMHTCEKSQRAFDLTTDVISHNTANYTAWQYRRDILLALDMDLKKELRYTSDMGAQNVKNYQIWHHRRFLVQQLKYGAEEIDYCNELLEDDSKNYHAWTHRQWVLKEFKEWDNELKYIDLLLSQDVRNNSAWNHRHFVITNTTGYTDEVVEKEVAYTLDKIRVAPNNESPWNYLTGALLCGKLTSVPDVKAFAEEMMEKGIRSPYVAATLAKIYEEECAQGREDSRKEAINMYDKLSTDLDGIRRTYWEHRKNALLSV